MQTAATLFIVLGVHGTDLPEAAGRVPGWHVWPQTKLCGQTSHGFRRALSAVSLRRLFVTGLTVGLSHEFSATRMCVLKRR